MKLIGRIPESETYLIAEDEFPTGEPPPVDAQAQVLRVTGEQATLYPPREFLHHGTYATYGGVHRE